MDRQVAVLNPEDHNCGSTAFRVSFEKLQKNSPYLSGIFSLFHLSKKTGTGPYPTEH